jgi:signal transduction histidine kinase
MNQPASTRSSLSRAVSTDRLVTVVPEAKAPILIADDDSRICGLIEETLRQAGHRVVCTHSGSATVDWLRHHGTRLLVLDVRLPDMDANRVLDALDPHGRRVPFVVISGMADTKMAVEFMRRGARDYLVKDPGFLELVPEVVARALQDTERDQELERLQQEVLAIAEREQRRIGQDLHDDLCQRLAAIKMQLQQLAEDLGMRHPGDARKALTIASHLADATRAARALARGLSPVDVGHAGLPAALRGLARNAEEIFQVTCELQTSGPFPALDHNVATQLYRIAQEAVTNAVKHGRADTITIHLLANPKPLVLTVSNDGKRFRRGGGGRTGVGLHLMRLRAESINATLHFLQNPPGDGNFAVRVTLPLE